MCLFWVLKMGAPRTLSAVVTLTLSVRLTFQQLRSVFTNTLGTRGCLARWHRQTDRARRDREDFAWEHRARHYILREYTSI